MIGQRSGIILRPDEQMQVVVLQIRSLASCRGLDVITDNDGHSVELDKAAEVGHAG